jgi:hypothetical protein
MPGILNQEVQLTVGDSTLTLSIRDYWFENTVELDFSNTQPSADLTIFIPEVKSNSQVGTGVDENTTGLGILKIRTTF